MHAAAFDASIVPFPRLALPNIANQSKSCVNAITNAHTGLRTLETGQGTAALHHKVFDDLRLSSHPAPVVRLMISGIPVAITFVLRTAVGKMTEQKLVQPRTRDWTRRRPLCCSGGHHLALPQQRPTLGGLLRFSVYCWLCFCTRAFVNEERKKRPPETGRALLG